MGKTKQLMNGHQAKRQRLKHDRITAELHELSHAKALHQGRCKKAYALAFGSPTVSFSVNGKGAAGATLPGATQSANEPARLPAAAPPLISPTHLDGRHNGANRISKSVHLLGGIRVESALAAYHVA